MKRASAGSYDLNRWLHGGYESDIITVIYGPPGSGKTNFCILAAVSQAKKGNKVLFIDSEGGFSVDRISQIAGSQTAEVLKNIVVLKPTNFEEQAEAFTQLSKYVKNNLGLIVVDGMTILYRLAFAIARQHDEEGIKKVNSELVREMQLLAEISRKNQIPVITTNQVYRWEDEQKMVAGDIMKYWCKCLIELSNEKGKRIARLCKHRSLPESEMAFYIINEGIKKRGWI